MKKTLICVIAGGIVAIAGAGIFATTLAHGATGYDSRFITVGVNREDGEFELGFWQDDDDDYRSPTPSAHSAPSAPSVSASTPESSSTTSVASNDTAAALSRPEDASVLTAADLLALKIDVKSATVEVQQGKTFDVSGRGVGDLDWSYDQASDTVTVASQHEVTYFDDDDRVVYITLPQNTALDTLTAEIGTGDFELKQANVAEITVSTGMGDIDIENFTATNIAAVSGMGDISLENGTANAASLTTGMGELDVSGSTIETLSGETGMGDIEASGPIHNFDLSTGSGEVEMALRGSASDYYVNLTNSMGTIQSPSGTSKNGSVTLGSSSAPYQGSVSTGTGSIEFRFTNK